jgi:O-acetylserine/cysteine efflux transporter
MKPHDLAFALLINAVWGFQFVAAKVAVEAFPPIFVTGVRFLLVIALLFPFLRAPHGQWLRVLGITIFAGALHFALMFAGIKLADDISSVAIVTQMGVPFATLLAVFFLHEHIHWRRTAGIVGAFAGVAIMGFDPRVLGYIDAILLLMAAAFIMAVGQVLMRGLKGVGVFNLQAWIALVSAPSLLALSWLIEADQEISMAEASLVSWGAIAYSALGASVIGHGGIYYLLNRYPVSLVSPTMLLAPVFGVASGVLVMGDVLSPRMIVGGLLVLGGALVITLRQPTALVVEVE